MKLRRSTWITWLSAIALTIGLFLAYALCSDDALKDLCEAKDWPTDAETKLAYKNACHTKLNPNYKQGQ